MLKYVLKLCAYFFHYTLLELTLKRRDRGLVNFILMLFGRIIKIQLSVCLDVEGLASCLCCFGVAPELNTSLCQVDCLC